MQLLEIEIIGVAVAYALFAIFIQRVFTNRKKVYEIQNTIKEKQNKYNELMKLENVAKEDLEKIQREITALMPEMFRHQLKSMVILLVGYAIIYYELLPLAFASASGKTTFTQFNLDYKALFFWVAVVCSFIFSTGSTMYDSRKMKKAEVQPQPPSPQQ